MKRNITAFCSVLVLFASLTLHVSASFSQTRELELEKILNPMPDYDPFEKSASTPQYFPDDVDKRARELLIDALTNRKEVLEDHLKSLRAEDERLRKQNGTATGLTEHTRDLVNNTIQDRERYLAAQKEALKNASTPERKKYLEAIINHDDLNQSEQLMRQSSTNFWGGMMNRLISSVDLIGVASGNYIGAVAETTITQVYALMDRDMPIEQRRALARNLDHLKRFPDDPRNAAIMKEVETLDKKKKSALIRKQIEKAKEALAKDDFDKALFHSDVAAFLDPQSKNTDDIRAQATKSLQQLEEAKKTSLTALTERKSSAEQQGDVKQLLQALTLRDSNQVQRLAIDLSLIHI